MKAAIIRVVIACAFVFSASCGDRKAKDEKDVEPEVGERISLDFHLMSKCPFGVKVMQAIAPILGKMGDNIDFNAHYIGNEKDGELTSMHGEQEVQGNILQLCARELGDEQQWLSFIDCQNEDWRRIPEGWEKCAERGDLDRGAMKDCYEGDRGRDLLRASIKVSQERKATGSPTIFLGGEPYRGGRSESSFGRALCAAFQEAKPGYCDEIPAPVKVPVTIVGDKRCTGRNCDARRFLSFVGTTFEGAEIRELDYSEEEGKALYERSGEEFLPIAIFGPEVEKEETGFNRLKRRLKEIEGTDEMVYPLGRDWNPTAEICDDGIDNTGNGLTDCDDPTCKGKRVCREEIKGKLDLFVMSQCPHGTRVVNAVREVLEAFGKNRKRIDFTLEFFGREVDGRLTSMHGQGEVDENIRQVCAQKHFARNYRFMDYVYCRNEAFGKTRGKEPLGNEWEACATDGIRADVIRRCAEGEEGKELLRASFAKASELGIVGSPSWLLNNKLDMNARDSATIKRAFCEENREVPGCEAEPPGPQARGPVTLPSCACSG